jgi:predicted transcriptional regulator
MNRRAPRNRLSILYDILVCCTAKSLMISEISRKANVSADYLYDFVDGLVESGFLSQRFVRGHNVFSTSQSGHVLMLKYDALLAVDNPKCPALQELACLKSYVL